MDINNIAENRRLLKRYLSRYYKVKEKRKILERRLQVLQAELRYPELTPPSSSSILFPKKKDNGDILLAFQIGDIEDRIRIQIEMQRKSIIEIMDIIDFLPIESTERDILEHRHIDCKSWSDICKLVHLTRSPCFEHYNKALDKLLTFKKVRATLEEFENRLTKESSDAY